MSKWRCVWVLVLACGSQPQRVHEPAPEPEPSRVEVADPVEHDRPPELPEIPAAETVEWPERFLGRALVDLLTDTTRVGPRGRSLSSPASLQQLYRDDGHRAFELDLVPIDDVSGWVVDRGIITSPDYSQVLYERWSRVQLRDGVVAILERVGRSEARAARSESREARFDAIRAHYEACVEACESGRCRYQCGEVATQQINAPHRLQVGDAHVTIHAPTIRIEWGEHTLGLDEISRDNVDDHPTRPLPLFVRVRRATLATGRDAVILGYGSHCDEDAYCPTTRVFVLGEAGIEELEGDFNRAGDVELRGDGTIRWLGGDSRMCEPTARQRADHLASIDPDLDPDPDNYWWHQHREIRLGARIGADGSVTELPPRPQRWSACTATFAAACPFVDIVTEQGATRVGEILRWIRDEPGTQGLALPTLSGERVRIRLSEEKLETTYLDAVWLELDGQRVDPIEPMAPDGRYEVMQRGDAIELEFPLHPHTEARLVAVGYYVVRASMAR